MRAYTLECMRLHRRIALVVVALFVAAAAIAFAPANPFASSAPSLPTPAVAVQRATVAATVTATGSLVYAKQVRLVFADSGRIRRILVGVGDEVMAGQPLAELASDNLQIKLDTATSQLAEAKLRLQQLTEGAPAEEIAVAQAAYDAAVARYNYLVAGPAPADLQSSEAALAQAQSVAEQAQARLSAIQAGPTDADQTIGQAAVVQAKGTLDTAQAKLDQLQAGPLPGAAAQAKAAVDVASAQLEAARTKLDAQRATEQDTMAPVTAAHKQAVLHVNTAKARLDQVRSSHEVGADVAQAQASVAAAAARLHTASQQLDQLSSSLALAQINLASEQSARTAARKAEDATCKKLGGGSAECAAAKSRIDALSPQILRSEQEIKLLQGDGSWEHLAAQKEVVAAQEAYDAAAANLKQTEAVQSVSADLVEAQSNYDAAVIELSVAESKLGETNVSIQTARTVGQAEVDTAEANLRSAQAKLDELVRGPSDADLVGAESAVQSAQAGLDASQAKLANLSLPAQTDLQTARAAARAAQLGAQAAATKLDQSQHGPRPDEVASARSEVIAAAAALAAKSGTAVRRSDSALLEEAVRQAELAVQQAQLELDNATLRAPFDGIVGAINGSPGETAPVSSASTNSTNGNSNSTSPGGFITLIDPHVLRADVAVDETDIARVALGNTAVVAVDALGGRSFEGSVSAVSLIGTTNQGVVTYPVSIGIDSGDQVLPSGLTASANIRVDQHDNVLVVPVRAVRRQGGDQMVQVVGPGGELIDRFVSTGLKNDHQIEIISGLSEGEQIVMPTTLTRAPSTSLPIPGVQLSR